MTSSDKTVHPLTPKGYKRLLRKQELLHAQLVPVTLSKAGEEVKRKGWLQNYTLLMRLWLV